MTNLQQEVQQVRRELYNTKRELRTAQQQLAAANMALASTTAQVQDLLKENRALARKRTKPDEGEEVAT